ncbi:MAG TPA: MFS transporter [Thermoleophilaceae bacterium]|jgi:MFS family permease|nr:MFS transporter [Thermoleophilaceae bacterium]
MRLPRIHADTTALRESRELRSLVLGNFVSGMGTQASLVALPYQLYVQTKSPLLTGLLGAAELIPLMTMALVGGALADRVDRRRLLLLDQVALVLIAGALCAAALGGEPPVWLLYVLGALLAGFGAVQNVARSAIIPNLVRPELLRSALAVNYGLYQLTMVVGPGLGGLLISAGGVELAYGVDALSCAAMVLGVLAISAQPPKRDEDAPDLNIRRSIAEGLRFVRRSKALIGSFAIDLNAMAFGMPRALFPVLAVSVYHAGASGTGLLYAAVSAGATVAALTTGWLEHVRRLGLIVIGAVVAWGLAVFFAALVPSLWFAAAMLALAGAADSVSAVCRNVINQSLTPDAMRGRMSSIFSLVVTSGPRVGDIESGTVASLTSARFSMASGGLACIAGVGLIMLAFPQLAAFELEQTEAPLAEAAA